MNRKLLVLFMAIIALLSACNLQNKSSNSLEEVSVSEMHNLPIGVNLRSLGLCNTPTRRQYYYFSYDGTKRLVLELQRENADDVDIQSKTSVFVGKNEGVAYLYSGEKVVYGGLSDTMIAGIQKMNAGDYVIEWSQNGYFLRIFGAYTYDELLRIAEGIEVISNE